MAQVSSNAVGPLKPPSPQNPVEEVNEKEKMQISKTLSTLEESEYDTEAPTPTHGTKTFYNDVIGIFGDFDMKYFHIVYSIPFFSTAAMSIPFVYLSIYLVDVFHTPVSTTGIILASIRLGAILGSIFNMLAPRLSAVLLLLLSIGGFTGLFFEETSSNLISFSCCNMITGVCGSSSYVQIFAKQEWGTDMTKMRKAIPMQWVVNGFGFGFGALISGLIFDSFGVRGVAGAGFVLQGTSLGSVCHYLCIAKDCKGMVYHEKVSGKIDSEDSKEYLKDTENVSKGTNIFDAPIPDPKHVYEEETDEKRKRPFRTSFEQDIASIKHEFGDKSIKNNLDKGDMTTFIKDENHSGLSDLEVGASNGEQAGEKNKTCDDIVVAPDSTVRDEIATDTTKFEFGDAANEEKAKSRTSRVSFSPMPTESFEQENTAHHSNMSSPRVVFEQNGDDKQIQEKKNDLDAPADGIDFSLRRHTVQKWMKESARSGDLRPTLVRNFSDYKQIKKTGFVSIISLMFALASITTGSFLSVGPIYVVQQFGRSEATIGTLLAVSQFAGTVTNLLIFTKKGLEIQKKYLPTPYNSYALFIVVAVFACLLLVPSFAMQAICVMMIFIFNVPLLSTIGEVQGAVSTSKEYSSQGPLGNIIYSAFHLVVALILPKLYDVNHLLPYSVAGIVSILLALFFILSFQRRIRQNSDTLSVFQVHSESDNNARMTFVSQEVLARMVRTARFSRISRISRMSRFSRVSNVRRGTQQQPVDSA